MDTKTQIDRLTELTILHRSQLRELANQLPGLRAEVVAEFERRMDEAEPHFREELQAFAKAQTEQEISELSVRLKTELDTISQAAQKRVTKKIQVILAEKKAVSELMKKAQSEIKGVLNTVPEKIETVVGLQAEAIREETKVQLETHFAIPRTLNPRGYWKKGTVYQPLDLVSDNGSSYVANVRNQDVKPGLKKEEWTLIARRGAGGGMPVGNLTELVGTPSDGQLLIGDSGNYVSGNLSAGYGVTITEGPGTIEISTSGFVVFKGTWNASTNTPALASGVGTSGFYYVVATQGSTNLDGITDWNAGDWAIFNGTAWEKVDNSEIITSVNGQTGVVVITKTDVGLGSVTDDAQLKIASNLSDLDNNGTARTNLGLGNSATLDVGTTAGTVAAGDDARLSDARTPTAHAASHVDGTDDIRDATASLNGLATAAQIAKLDGITAEANVGITELTGDVTAGPGGDSQATTIADEAVTFAKMQNIGTEKLIGRHSAGSGDPQQVGIAGGLEFQGANIQREALTGDVTASAGSNSTTLANTAVTAASYGSATQVGSFTVDTKGRLTAASDVTVTPAFSNVTSTPTTLSGYGITDAVNTSDLGAANGVATLDSGSKLTSSQLPDIAVTEYLGDSANESAMLALTGQQGDWTTRTDLGTVWIITGTDPSVIGGWTQLSYPTAPVTSVAGKTGAVTLASADVGLGNVTNDAQLKIASNLADLDNATTGRTNLGLGNVDNTSDANKPVSTAQQTALDLKADLISPTLVTPALGTPSSGVVTNLTGTASININGTVGATTPSTGAFTTLSASGTVTLSSPTGLMYQTNDANQMTLLGGASGSGAKLQLFGGTNVSFPGQAYLDADTIVVRSASGANTRGSITSTGLNSMAIGATTPSTGAFTTVEATGNINLADNQSLNWSTAPGRPYIVGNKASDLIKLGTPTGGDLLNLVGAKVGIGTTSPNETLTVSGSLSTSSYVAGAGTNPGGLGGSKWIYDWFSGQHRQFSMGADASTNGEWAWYSQRSDGTNAVIPMTLTSTGLAVTGAVSATGALTAQTYAVIGAGANSGYVTFRNTTSTSGFDVGLLAGAGSADAYVFNRQASSNLILGTSGTERMRITSAGNVGIGTASPASLLSLEKDGALGIRLERTGAYPAVCKIENSGGFLALSNDATGINFLTGATPAARMQITSAGNVGIGTASPAAKLDIVSTGSSRAIQANDSDTATTGYQQIMGLQHSGTDMVSITTGPWTTVAFPEGGAIFSTGGVSNVLTMNSAGNVGIGTSSPARKLTVNSGSSNTAASFISTDNYALINFEDSATTTETSLGAYANDLVFRVGAAEKMRITSAGDVIIGGTALPSGTTQAAAWDNASKYVRVGTSVSTAATLMAFYNSNGAVGTITTSGTATAYNTSSDYRLKENVVPMQDALQRITQLKPSRFNFVADDSVVVDGFLAHEVQEVVPEAISGQKDAMRDEEYEVTPAVLDDDGNETTPAVMDTRSVPDYQGIDQSKLVPLLVGAIQELTARIESLESN